jgi:16S rRNA (guanine966-N2)-methyltransferase
MIQDPMIAEGASQMRVITGTARGRRLKELEGMETRPTTDRVKEGLFSALQFEIEGRRVLDLFAGTGQLGIECLSRGAALAVFVDRRADAVKLIRENLKLTELEDRARVVPGDSMEYLSAVREKFDLIFLDPPYEAGLMEPALAHIAKFDILSPYGIIIAETPADRRLPALNAPYGIARTYRYGKIGVTLYRRTGNENIMQEDD